MGQGVGVDLPRTGTAGTRGDAPPWARPQQHGSAGRWSRRTHRKRRCPCQAARCARRPSPESSWPRPTASRGAQPRRNLGSGGMPSKVVGVRSGCGILAVTKHSGRNPADMHVQQVRSILAKVADVPGRSASADRLLPPPPSILECGLCWPERVERSENERPAAPRRSRGGAPNGTPHASGTAAAAARAPAGRLGAGHFAAPLAPHAHHGAAPHGRHLLLWWRRRVTRVVR